MKRTRLIAILGKLSSLGQHDRGISADVDRLRALADAPTYPANEAFELLQRVARQGSPEVRRAIHQAIMPRSARISMQKHKEHRENQKKSVLAKVTFVADDKPLQGGAPGLGKRS